MVDSLGIVGYDSFHFVVADLERSRRFYAGLGFSEVARASVSKIEKGGEVASVFGAGQIRVLVSSPKRKDSRAARFLRIHPDGISSLALRVRDIQATWDFLAARNATFLSDIAVDEAPGGTFRTFNIATPLDDVTFRFIERQGKYPRFAPDFEDVGDGTPLENPHGFATIDHVTSNAYTMLPVVNWYRDVLGFTHYWDVEFHTAEMAGGRRLIGSGLRSIVMADPQSGVKFATNEPMRPFFRESQINRFCEDHHGAGVQHIAFLVKEIIPAVEALRAEGIQFLKAPGAYYDRLPKRLEDVKITNVREPMDALRRNHILLDGADDKYMLQIFMLDATAMYGDEKAGPFFYEIIQREGDRGFGYGNFRALFESIEATQREASPALEVVGCMIDRMQLGEVPPKPHTAFRSSSGALRYEECLTRRGFDGEFSILYHEGPPMTDSLIGPAAPGRFDRKAPIPAEHQPLRRRLLLGEKAPEGFTPVLFNGDVAVSFFKLPREAESPDGFSNGDGDELFFFYEGEGIVESPFGDLPFRRNDYLLVPRGTVQRLRISSPLEGILFELRGGAHIPREFRNPVGQLRMDAPYTHRDFVRPAFKGPRPGPKRILVKKDDAFVERFPLVSPFDVIGWDGTVWPFAFDILKYQPKTGLVHLPPTIHSTFGGRNALICSFVPRVTDTHPDAIPCPYPHASVDCDEIIYYVRGSFTSRKGVGPKAVSLHPAGVPHGPHPGAYEGSIGSRSTDELAVMMDTFAPLRLTEQALALEHPGYHDSWIPG